MSVISLFSSCLRISHCCLVLRFQSNTSSIIYCKMTQLKTVAKYLSLCIYTRRNIARSSRSTNHLYLFGIILGFAWISHKVSVRPLQTKSSICFNWQSSPANDEVGRNYLASSDRRLAA